MNDRRGAYRILRISEKIAKPFEKRKRLHRVPGPFNTYFEGEVAKMFADQTTLIILREEVAEIKKLLVESLKEPQIKVSAFRPPEERHGQRKAG